MGPSDKAELEAFFAQPYWRRAWVIQEITVASKVTVLYGYVELLWVDVAAFYTLYKGVEQINPVDSLDHLLEFRERYFVNRTPISLFKAMDLSRKTLATDPRDKIFALLGLCHDGSTFVPVPNYKQSLESVIADMSRAMITLDKSLKLICLRGALGSELVPNLPSWAPNWPKLWAGGTTALEDILIAQQDVGKFNPLLEGSTSRLLKVQGTRVGAVTSITSAMRPHGTPSSQPARQTPWILSTFRLGLLNPELASPSPDVSKFYNAIWRTLIMALLQPPNSPMEAKACFSLLWMPHGRGSIHDLNLIDWIDSNAIFKIGRWTLREWSQVGGLSSSLDGSYGSYTFANHHSRLFNSGIQAFLSTLQKTLSSGMRLACLDTRVYFIALVHPETQEGDKIYYLRGCTTPVILRRTPDPDTCQYTVVGAAYIDDIQEWTGPEALLEDITLC